MLFPEIFEDAFRFPDFRKPAVMQTDVKEFDDHFELKIDLPGFSKEDITVEQKPDSILVKATRKSEEGDYLQRERYFGSYSRSFSIRCREEIKASFEDGVLTLSVPKESPKEEKKLISIQ